MSGEHAFLPPSGAAHWSICAAWPAAQRDHPQMGDKLEAMEGEAAHWAFAELLAGRQIDVGLVAPNNVTLTEEMIEGADMYASEVGRAYHSLPSVTAYHVEQRVQNAEIHAENWGTPDTWLFGHDATTGRARLIAIDYKFGHEFVEVFRNMQLVNYVALILAHLEVFPGLSDDLVDIEFVVVQPRSYHRDGPVRRWITRAITLRALFNVLRSAAGLATLPDPKATPAPSACKHCTGRHACAALQTEAYSAADQARDSVPIDMPVAAQALELRMLERAQKLLNARISGLREQVEHSIRAGQPNPYYAVEHALGRRAWTRPAAEIVALGAMLGHDLSKPDVVTPTQAVKAGIDEAIVNAYSDRPRGSASLVAVDTLGARKVFGGI